MLLETLLVDHDVRKLKQPSEQHGSLRWTTDQPEKFVGRVIFSPAGRMPVYGFEVVQSITITRNLKRFSGLWLSLFGVNRSHNPLSQEPRLGMFRSYLYATSALSSLFLLFLGQHGLIGMMALQRTYVVITPLPYKSGERLPSRVMRRPSTTLALCTARARAFP